MLQASSIRLLLASGLRCESGSPSRLRINKTAALPELLAYYEDGEGAGLHFAAALAGSWRFEFGGGEKDLVRFQVEAHGAGCLFGRDIFDHAVFVGGIFVD